MQWGVCDSSNSEGSNVQQIGSTLKNLVCQTWTILSIYASIRVQTWSQVITIWRRAWVRKSDLIQELQKGGTPEPQEPVLANLTIPEGYTLEQIAQTVGQLKVILRTSYSGCFPGKKLKMKPSSPNYSCSIQTFLVSSNKDSGVRYRLEGYFSRQPTLSKTALRFESLIDDMLAAMTRPCHRTTLR